MGRKRTNKYSEHLDELSYCAWSKTRSQFAKEDLNGLIKIFYQAENICHNHRNIFEPSKKRDS